MKPLTRLAAAVLALGAPLCHAQEGKPTDMQITGYVYEPARLAVDDASLAKLRVPQGFTIAPFADGLDNPRMLAVARDGTVYVTQRKPGNVVMLRDLDGDGRADVKKVVAELPQVHGIAIAGEFVYLADIRSVHMARLLRDGSIGRLTTVVDDLPDGGQHPNRTLAFSPDGAMYVSVGSTCNACLETRPESATLLRVTPERRSIFASGLRNTIGFGWHPPSGRLYGMDHGIDWLGNDQQGEELNELQRATRYGWPFVYGKSQINPQDEPPYFTNEEWARTSQEPVALYTAHSAPMQMVFYTGSQFPEDFRGDAFVAMRGSWNRKPPSGYEVLRVKFDDAGNFEAFEPFATGFLQESGGSHGFIGRPTGIAQARDGALLVSDDTNNVIYRIAHGAASAARSGASKLASELMQPRAQAPLQVQSPAVGADGHIDEKYSDYKAGVSPPLAWSGLPQGTRSVVLIMEDPQAKSPRPFVHWMIANIPPEVDALPENVPNVDRPLHGSRLIQGANSKSTTGYFGPRPPDGEPAHPYHFQAFALDAVLDLPPGYTRETLLRAMQGHVLAHGTLVGRFAKPDDAIARR